MNKNKILIAGMLSLFILIIGIISINNKEKVSKKTEKITGTVMHYDEASVTVQDYNFIIYTFDLKNADLDSGDNVTIKYTGVLDNYNCDSDKCRVISYDKIKARTTEDGIKTSWEDNGIFSAYYTLAMNKLKTLSLDEKIGQLLLARYPSTNQIEALKKYYLSGFIFFERDFTGKTESEVQNMISTIQNEANIPLLTAVDEEGGRVVRVSSNQNLVPEKFKSSSDLYNSGGFNKIKEDTINKSKILYNLGLNLNLAPVVDVSTNSSDYIYNRSFKQNTSLTSTYAKTVIEASKDTGVSYTLKHFPGYGNNSDTHIGSSVDTRPLSDIKQNDIPPFESGIEAGAEAVLVSHNVVNNLDNLNPASLSSSVHNLLRDDLGFTGIIMSDDLSMSALDGIDNISVKALLAGNDIIITTDYENSFNQIKNSIKDGTISEEQIDKLAFRVLAWKYYKLIMSDNEK